MLEVYIRAIIGGIKVGKGSTMRAVTGLHNGVEKPWAVALTNGETTQLYVPRVRSINEGADAMTPEQWVMYGQEKNDANGEVIGRKDGLMQAARTRRLNVLACLRLEGENGRSAEDYITLARDKGMKVESVIVIGEVPEWLKLSGLPYGQVPEALPTNAKAAVVRKMWGWR